MKKGPALVIITTLLLITYNLYGQTNYVVKDTIDPAKSLDSLQVDTSSYNTSASDTILKIIDTLVLPPGQIDADTNERLFDSINQRVFLQTHIPYSFLRKVLKNGEDSPINDTLRNPLRNMLWHYDHEPIEISTTLVKKYLARDSLLRQIRDSSDISLNDTLSDIITSLISQTEEDSIPFFLTNNRNDTLKIWLTPGSKDDSKRFILYDDKDTPAGLWVNQKKKNVLGFKLDDNTWIEKTETKEVINKHIPTILPPLNLEKNREIHMIFPQWDIGGVTDLHFNQGYLSNWVQGGESSLSSLFDIKLNMDYKKGKTIWDNDLEYKYGLIQSGEQDIRKNEDILEINSKYGTNAGKDWYYSALLNFKTQFFKGYDYPDDSTLVSGFLAPATLVFSLGMDYKPNENLTILLSPISSKFTIMRDTSKFMETKFGLQENQFIRKELGAYVKSILQLEINENISAQNKINLFTNYLRNPQNIDIDWELTLDMKITDYISTKISTHLIYDDDVEIPVYETVDGKKKQVDTTKKIQFKEVISVGLSFKFKKI